VGIVIGVGGAVGLSRLLQTMLFELSPTDPVSFVLVSAGLLLVAIVAAWWPARRAVAVDPLTALRAE
jgi:ABC-type antimicrobial peptide transport system permease subunit